MRAIAAPVWAAPLVVVALTAAVLVPVTPAQAQFVAIVDGTGSEAPATERTAAPTCSVGSDSPTPTEVAVTAVPIVVASTTADYFVLYASHEVVGTTVEFEALEYPVQVALGQDGTTTLSENVAALPAESYRVEKYSLDDPADVDGDCIDDITELADAASMNPVNPADDLELPDRFTTIPDHQTYETLAYVSSGGGEHLKFVIDNFDTDRPSVFFQDTNRFQYHTSRSELGRPTVRGTIEVCLSLPRRSAEK